jgi:hypothetical protein
MGVIIQCDSLARGLKLLSIKNYVNQLTDDDLTTGHYQQDGATCHTSNASMREIESFFFQDRIISKNIWPPRSPDLTPSEFFLWGLLKVKVYKNTSSHNRTNQRRYTPRDSSRQRRHFGKSNQVCLDVKGDQFQHRL